ncbi:hypothetical protein [Kitasatospora sp. LaBMicrA B282]|uniref:hypothetical protein n=1 Tax=Kitasatospora sp. LaBMicrA B282 TaxID=3420949 RepID=UPI003D12C9DA
MNWERLATHPPLDAYLQEVALFLEAHLDHSPGLLWPEQEPELPRTRDGVPDAILALHVVEGLTQALERPVEALGTTVPAGPAATHLLVLQTAGAGQWTLSPARTDDDRPPLTMRLLEGEALYVPPGYTATATHTEAARQVVLGIGESTPKGALAGAA